MPAHTYHWMFVICIIHLISTDAEPIQGYNIVIASENEFPYVASIGLKLEHWNAVKNHKCTGVLITKKLILTAARCLRNRTVDEIQVILGSIDLTDGTKYDVDFFITYNKWANNTVLQNKIIINDIAIIRLAKEVDESVARPAILSSKKCGELNGGNAVMAGWGIPNWKIGKASRYLQKADVTIYPHEDCERIVSELKNITVNVPRRLLCTKADPYTLLSCGDSGGPVVVGNSVIGINKGTCPYTEDNQLDFTEEFLKSHKVNLHAKIEYFRNFIDDVITNYSM